MAASRVKHVFPTNRRPLQAFAPLSTFWCDCPFLRVEDRVDLSLWAVPGSVLPMSNVSSSGAMFASVVISVFVPLPIRVHSGTRLLSAITQRPRMDKRGFVAMFSFGFKVQGLRYTLNKRAFSSGEKDSRGTLVNDHVGKCGLWFFSQHQ